MPFIRMKPQASPAPDSQNQNEVDDLSTNLNLCEEVDQKSQLSAIDRDEVDLNE